MVGSGHIGFLQRGLTMILAHNLSLIVSFFALTFDAGLIF